MSESKGPLRLVPNPTFRGPVELLTPEGSSTVVFTFKHRPKSAMPAFFESIKDKEDLFVVKQIVSGWDLAEEFNDENVSTLLDNYHQAAMAITTSYVGLLTQFKKGN